MPSKTRHLVWIFQTAISKGRRQIFYQTTFWLIPSSLLVMFSSFLCDFCVAALCANFHHLQSDFEEKSEQKRPFPSNRPPIKPNGPFSPLPFQHKFPAVCLLLALPITSNKFWMGFLSAPRATKTHKRGKLWVWIFSNFSFLKQIQMCQKIISSPNGGQIKAKKIRSKFKGVGKMAICCKNLAKNFLALPIYLFLWTKTPNLKLSHPWRKRQI